MLINYANNKNLIGWFWSMSMKFVLNGFMTVRPRVHYTNKYQDNKVKLIWHQHNKVELFMLINYANNKKQSNVNCLINLYDSDTCTCMLIARLQFKTYFLRTLTLDDFGVWVWNSCSMVLWPSDLGYIILTSIKITRLNCNTYITWAITFVINIHHNDHIK
jgi:hypothetical protein